MARRTSKRYTPPKPAVGPGPAPQVMGFTAVCRVAGACEWHPDVDTAEACARAADQRTGHFHTVKRASRYGGVFHNVTSPLAVLDSTHQPIRLGPEPAPCFRD